MGFIPITLLLKADGEWNTHPLVPFAFCLSIFTSWPGTQAGALPMTSKWMEGRALSLPSPSPLYPHSLSFNPILGLFQPGSPILGSLVHITTFWVSHNLLFYFNYFCCIIFGLALKVEYPSHHSSCQGVAICFVSYNPINPWTSPPLA